MGKRIPVAIQPGMVKVPTNTPNNTLRIVDGSNITFLDGKLAMRKGHREIDPGTMLGYARSGFNYRTASAKYTIVGTSRNLYAYNHTTAALTNISPLVTATTALPNNPVTTPVAAAGPITVTVAVSVAGDRPLLAGARVKLLGLAATDGVAAAQLNAEHIVVAVPTATTFTITVTTTGSAGATGGGAAGTIQNQIAVGNDKATSTLSPRVWDFDLYGTNLLASPCGGTGLYSWNGSIVTAPTLVTNAPTAINGFFVLNNIPITYGASGVGERIKWPDSEDITDWTAAADNYAGEDDIENAGEFIGHLRVAQDAALLATSSKILLVEYVDKPAIFKVSVLTEEDGFASKRAACFLRGIAYIFGRHDFYRWYGGRVEALGGENPRDHVFRNADVTNTALGFNGLNPLYYQHAFAAALPQEGKVKFWYAEDTGAEGRNDNYAEYDVGGEFWVHQDDFDSAGPATFGGIAAGEHYDWPIYIECSSGGSNGSLWEYGAIDSDGDETIIWSATTAWAPLGNGDVTFTIQAVYPDRVQDAAHDIGVVVETAYEVPPPGSGSSYNADVTSSTFALGFTTTEINVAQTGRFRRYILTNADYAEDSVPGGIFVIGKFYEEIEPDSPR